MTTYSRAEWGARAPRPGPGLLEPGDVTGLVFHWPATSKPIRGFDAVAAALRGWQRYHMDGLGWSDIAYQVAMDQDGNRYVLRGLRRQSAANGGSDVNEDNGAVLLVLAPGEQPTPAMIREVRRVVIRHRALFPLSRKLLGHNDVRPEPTACPGPIVAEHLAQGTFEPVTLTRGYRIDRALADLRAAQSNALDGTERDTLIRQARRRLRQVKAWPKR